MVATRSARFSRCVLRCQGSRSPSTALMLRAACSIPPIQTPNPSKNGPSSSRYPTVNHFRPKPIGGEGIAPNPQARVVDSCSTSSRAAVTVARNRTQLAANQQSACRSDLPGQQCRMPVMTPEKLDMAHRLLAEGNGQADISADKRPNKKGGRNRPEKDMRHGPCAVRKRQCGPGAMVLATLKAAAAGAWPRGREA